jgi:hypothetical protein
MRQYFQKNIGWLIHSDSKASDFSRILDLYCFNATEKADFIEFWNKKLKSGVNYVAYPQETFIVDNVMPITINPVPCSMARIWFYFEEADEKTSVVEPVSVSKIRRDKFTVVEWGGMID